MVALMVVMLVDDSASQWAMMMVMPRARCWAAPRDARRAEQWGGRTGRALDSSREDLQVDKSAGAMAAVKVMMMVMKQGSWWVALRVERLVGERGVE